MRRLLFCLGLFIIASPVAYACKPEIASQRQAFKKAAAVFIGEVVDISDSDFQPIKSDKYFVTVKFKVIQYWKGSGKPELTVHSEQGALSCNLYQFRKGEKYLVYAYGKHFVVFTGSSRSAPLSWDGYINNELKILGEGKKAKNTEAKVESTQPPNNSLNRSGDSVSFMLLPAM